MNPLNLRAMTLIPVMIALALVIASARIASAIEEPRFDVVKAFDGFELRRYDAFVIAEIEIDDDFEEAGNQAFSPLFGYISGGNRADTEMEMTAPVLQRSGPDAGSEPPAATQAVPESGLFRISFVLPRRFDLDKAPPPSDSRIAVREVPGRLMAARRYSGFWSRESFDTEAKALFDALRDSGYEAVAAPEWARYDAPFMPWFLRRNEVLVEVRPTGS